MKIIYETEMGRGEERDIQQRIEEGNMLEEIGNKRGKSLPEMKIMTLDRKKWNKWVKNGQS